MRSARWQKRALRKGGAHDNMSVTVQVSVMTIVITVRSGDDVVVIEIPL